MRYDLWHGRRQRHFAQPATPQQLLVQPIQFGAKGGVELSVKAVARIADDAIRAADHRLVHVVAQAQGALRVGEDRPEGLWHGVETLVHGPERQSPAFHHAGHDRLRISLVHRIRAEQVNVNRISKADDRVHIQMPQIRQDWPAQRVLLADEVGDGDHRRYLRVTRLLRDVKASHHFRAVSDRRADPLIAQGGEGDTQRAGRQILVHLHAAHRRGLEYKAHGLRTQAAVNVDARRKSRILHRLLHAIVAKDKGARDRVRGNGLADAARGVAGHGDGLRFARRRGCREADILGRGARLPRRLRLRHGLQPTCGVIGHRG